MNGTKDNKSGFIASDLKAKYADKSRGITFTETWSTANVLGAQFELDNSLAKGLKLDLSGSLLPEKGTKNAKAGVEYKQDSLFTRGNLDLFKGPTLFADAVVGHNGYVVGGEAAYDVSEAKVTKYSYGLGYIVPQYSLQLLAANKLSLFTASYYHKVNATVEAGAKAVWNAAGESGVAVEVGTKYVLDSSAFLKAKVNNQGLLGLGFTQVLRDGIKVAFGGLFDTTKLNSDAHKVGVSFSFEAW